MHPKHIHRSTERLRTSDYESIVKLIYPDAESVSVVGGEELNPPKFGEVQISIKPKNDYFISDFNKQSILNRLKNYSLGLE